MIFWMYKIFFCSLNCISDWHSFRDGGIDVSGRKTCFCSEFYSHRREISQKEYGSVAKWNSVYKPVRCKLL